MNTAFNNRFNSLSSAQQEAVKKKLKEELDNGYDVNKVKNHIENYGNNTSSSTSSNSTTQNNTSNSYSNSTPNYTAPKQNTYGSTTSSNTNNSSSNNSSYSQPKQTNTSTNFGNTTTQNPYGTATTQKQTTPKDNTIQPITPIKPIGTTKPRANTGLNNNQNSGFNTTQTKQPKEEKLDFSTMNEDDIGIDKSNRKFKMSQTQKDQRAYMDLIQKKRDTEGFPKNPPHKGLFSEYLMPNWKGGMTRMTEEEQDNMPTEMTPKDKEWIKYHTNDKIRKENPGNFDSYWEKIKDIAEELPQEVKGLTRENFNKLNDEDKLKLYKGFVQYEQQQLKEAEKQREEQEKLQQEQVKQSQNTQTPTNTLEDLKAQRQKIYDGVQNMTKEQYNSLTDEQKKQINDTYQALENQISELENSKQEQSKQEIQTQTSNQSETEQQTQEQNQTDNQEIEVDTEKLKEEFGKEVEFENGELVIKGLKTDTGNTSDLKISLYDKEGNLKNKETIERELNMFFSPKLASTNTSGLGKYTSSNDRKTAYGIIFGPLILDQETSDRIKETEKVTKNPNYSTYTQTENYYKDLGLDYDFNINTKAENYDKNTAMFSQENLVNILGNKDLLHEVKLYPNGQKYTTDENGNKTENEAIIMYQVRKEGDTGGIYEERYYKSEYRGQCTYFVSKVLENAYPDAKLDGKSAFGLTRGVKTLIDNAEKIVDEEGNQLFEKSKIPSIGSVYLNPNEDKTQGNGHTAIVTDVKLIKKGKTEEENEYEITLIEQNSTIEKNGVQYEPLANYGGKEYGEKKDNSLDYTMVVGQKTMKVTGKSGITFIQKK